MKNQFTSKMVIFCVNLILSRCTEQSTAKDAYQWGYTAFLMLQIFKV